MKVPAAFLLVILAWSSASGEDLDLRNRAEHLMNRALIASRFATPLNIRTDVSFSVSGSDGLSRDGSYTRIRSADHALREDIVLGDYRMSRIQEQAQVSTRGQWVDIPYPIRKIFELVPYLPIRFDATDVITSIENAQTMGKPSTCIQFVTVRGEDHNPGEICLSRETGTVLEWHDRERGFEAITYESVKGALLPSHFKYQENNALAIDATVKWTLLDSRPDDAFIAPQDWHHAFYCAAFAMPVPVKSPQPAALGGINAPIITVDVRTHVRADGTVGHAEVIKPVRADLDEEAVQLIKTWIFQPGTCEGNKQEISIDVPIHFQGR